MLPSRDRGVGSVLVVKPQGVEDGKFVKLRGIPTVVRLKLTDDGDCLGPDIFRKSPKLAEALLVGDNRECRVFVRATFGEQSQLPRDVVKGGSKVVDDISEDRAEGRRRRAIWGNLIYHITEVVGIEATSEVIRVSFNESAGLPFEFVKVFTRSPNLESRTGNVGHGGSLIVNRARAKHLQSWGGASTPFL